VLRGYLAFAKLLMTDEIELWLVCPEIFALSGAKKK